MISQFVSKHPREVISEVFYNKTISVQVDGESADILKILKGDVLLIKTYGTQKYFKVSTLNERVEYKVWDEPCIGDYEVVVTLSKPELAPALEREIEIDEGTDISSLTQLYKNLGIQPIRVERNSSETTFVLVCELKPENLYSRDAIPQDKLRIYELVKDTNITFRCILLGAPDTTEIDLKQHVYKINLLKDLVVTEMWKEGCEMMVHVEH